MKPYKHAIVKFNNGNGALLCNACSVIIAYGHEHEDRKHYCDKCKEKMINKRILELAEQAGSTHKQNLGVYQFYTDELEKFAELIVQECAKIALEEDHEPSECILNHFGVKK